MKIPGFDIDVIEQCAHGVDMTDTCDECTDAKPHRRYRGGGDYGPETYGTGLTKDEATGRIIGWNGPKRFVRCPHGVLIPLVNDPYGNVTLPTVSKNSWFCAACEKQRADARAQDDRLMAVAKSLGRAKRVRKRDRGAYDAAYAGWLAGTVTDFGWTADGGVWTEMFTTERKAA